MAIVISDSVLPSASSDMWMLRNGIMDILLLWLIMKVWEKMTSIANER